MAGSLEAISLDKLESVLTCAICLEKLEDPRTLPCFHSFCEPCLENFVKTKRDKALSDELVKDFNCPTCRGPFTLNPEDKIADMMTNHFIYNMLEVMAVDQHRVKGVPCSHCEKSSVGRCVTCEVFLCQECVEIHNKYRGFTNHCVLSMDELSKPENRTKIREKLHCKQHKKKTLKFYCITCGELICRYCMDFNHAQKNHSCLPAEEVAESRRSLLSTNHATLEDMLGEGNKSLEAISNVIKSLDSTAENARSQISQGVQKILEILKQKLEEKARSLTDEVNASYSEKQNQLTQQCGEVKVHVDEVKRFVQLSKSLLDNGNNEEILSSQKIVQDNVTRLKNERPKNMEPVTNDTIPYTWHEPHENEFEEVTDLLGKIILDGSPVAGSGEEVDDESESLIDRISDEFSPSSSHNLLPDGVKGFNHENASNQQHLNEKPQTASGNELLKEEQLYTYVSMYQSRTSEYYVKPAETSGYLLGERTKRKNRKRKE